jgi:biotin synthase
MMDWTKLADQIIDGHRITRAEALSVLESPEDELLVLLHAAFRVRMRYHGREVKIHVLQNAKSGVCPEDCGFCSQSTKFKTGVPQYGMQTAEELVAAARSADKKGAYMYCMVTSTRGPSSKELAVVCDAVRTIRQEMPHLSICTSLGFLKPGQASALKDAGVTRYNHNLETSDRFFPEVVGTHGFEDRVNTVKDAKAAGLEACSGGILGLGETFEDRVDLALALRELQVESVPVNLLDPRPGTPLGGQTRLSPSECLRALCMFRFVHPEADVRVSGGREACLRTLQPLALYPANSIFTSGYLTTLGQDATQDWSMIREAGFEPKVVHA